MLDPNAFFAKRSIHQVDKYSDGTNSRQLAGNKKLIPDNNIQEARVHIAGKIDTHLSSKGQIMPKSSINNRCRAR